MQLTAVERTTKTQGERNALRKQFKIPAVVYGHGSGSRSIELESKEFERLYASAGTSNLIDLVMGSTKEPLKVLISDVQRDPMTDKVIHVDLHQVRMDEKIHTQITLEFVGEASAVKEFGGNLIIGADSIEIECLPKDLISTIKVDLSTLTKLDDSIHVSDLHIPVGITVMGDMKGSVVSVLAPRAEAVEETPTPETVVVGAEEKTGESAEGEAAVPAKETKES